MAVTVPLNQPAGAGAVMVTTGAVVSGFATVTATPADVAALSTTSNARAVSVEAPFGVRAVFQVRL